MDRLGRLGRYHQSGQWDRKDQSIRKGQMGPLDRLDQRLPPDPMGR